MSIWLATVLMFGTVLALLALGLPLAFSLGGTAAIWGFFLYGGQFSFIFISVIQQSMTSFVMVALPCFVFMAMVLERSGLADELYSMIRLWMGRLRGGLAMGTVLICTMFAAMCGNSAAATVTMGLIALPSMLNRGYDKRLAIGCVAGGGALGILIPPSVQFIIYGEIVGVSIGKLFMGGLFPGLLLCILFIAYIGVRSLLNPRLAPGLPSEERANWRDKFVSLRSIVLPTALVIGVLGSIFTGKATPSEAAAVGAAGSLVCAAIHGRLDWQLVKTASIRTITLSAMVMWIIFGAKCFTHIYAAIGASTFLKEAILGLPFGAWATLIGMQFTFFIMGMFLDPLGILMLTAPIYVPVATSLGFNPVWYGVLWVMNMEMAYLTPPFGFNLFYLKAVAPKNTTMGDIYIAIIPFVLLQATGLALVMLFPQIALWLPTMMIGT